MKTLHLNLKSCWYDLIEQGIKKEEYREMKPYWARRLCDNTYQHHETGEWVFEFKHFDAVKFTYGYTKRTMTFKIEDITTDTGKPQWGAEDGEEYFVIKIGERIN